MWLLVPYVALLLARHCSRRLHTRERRGEAEYGAARRSRQAPPDAICNHPGILLLLVGRLHCRNGSISKRPSMPPAEAVWQILLNDRLPCPAE